MPGAWSAVGSCTMGPCAQGPRILPRETESKNERTGWTQISDSDMLPWGLNALINMVHLEHSLVCSKHSINVTLWLLNTPVKIALGLITIFTSHLTDEKIEHKNPNPQSEQWGQASPQQPDLRIHSPNHGALPLLQRVVLQLRWLGSAVSYSEFFQEQNWDKDSQDCSYLWGDPRKPW